MRVHASLALPGVILAATAAASPQNYPSTPSFTYRAGGEPFGITFFGEEAAWRGWVAEDGGRIRYSDDGDEWIQAVVAGSVRGQLRGIQFIDDSVGFCVGDGGALLKTTNGGLNWTLLDTIFEPVAAETATLHQVYFHDEDDGWVMGDDLVLYHTTDGGDNWVEVTPQTPHNADFYDIAFPDPANRDLFVVARTDSSWGPSSTPCVSQSRTTGDSGWVTICTLRSST